MNFKEEARKVLAGYQFSLDNFKPGDTFDFETFSPAMLDSMVNQLQSLALEMALGAVGEDMSALSYSNKDFIDGKNNEKAVTRANLRKSFGGVE